MNWQSDGHDPHSQLLSQLPSPQKPPQQQ